MNLQAVGIINHEKYTTMQCYVLLLKSKLRNLRGFLRILKPCVYIESYKFRRSNSASLIERILLCNCEKELRFFTISASITVQSERTVLFAATSENLRSFTQPNRKRQCSPLNSSHKRRRTRMQKFVDLFYLNIIQNFFCQLYRIFSRCE
jgi:hypothetical protein